jgi:hypothetical protein
MMKPTKEYCLDLLIHAIRDALNDMDKHPYDSVEDIWNEHLESWKTGLRMHGDYHIEFQ